MQGNKKKLVQEYQEAWKSKKRWQEFKEWEFTSLTDAKEKWKEADKALQTVLDWKN